MVTLKKDSLSLNIIYVLIIAVSSFNALADNASCEKVLIDSYKLDKEFTEDKLLNMVGEIEYVLEECNNIYIKFRLRYREGILYFKASHLEKAGLCFEQITGSPTCPQLIRICSLNMAGQVFKMLGQDEKSLDAFEELMKIAEGYQKHGGKGANLSFLLKLYITAAFGRAEIYQYQKKYDAAILEYGRLLGIISRNESSEFRRYMPFVEDKISQLYLMKDDIKEYFLSAEKIIDNFPDFYRTAIIAFEIKAVKFLKDTNPECLFINGSFSVPSQLITFLKDNRDKLATEKIAYELNEIRNRYKGTYGAILLNYHYAWLLDILGQKEASAGILGSINCVEIKDVNNNPLCQNAASLISQYVKLQRAVILGETGNYTQALDAIVDIKGDPNTNHISLLATSIKESLLMLRREVPKNVTRH